MQYIRCGQITKIVPLPTVVEHVTRRESNWYTKVVAFTQDQKQNACYEIPINFRESNNR